MQAWRLGSWMMGASQSRQQQLLLLGLLGFCCWCCCSSSAVGESRSELVEGATAGAADHESFAETAAAAAAAAAADEPSERQMLEVLEGLAAEGLRALGPPPPLEVPDWSEGLIDREHRTQKSSSSSNSSSSSSSRTRVHFRGPFPPTRAWTPVYFSGYGDHYPMGPLLLACKPQPGGRAICDVVPSTPYTPPPGATLYRAWSLWGNQMTGGAFVSVETGVHGLERGPMGAPTPCCETSNNAANCMGCMGLPTAAYDPLKTETETPMESKDRHGGGGADAEGDSAADKDHSAAAAEGDYWPVGVAESFSPVAPQELFSLLPKLQQQLGGNPDPANLPCRVTANPPQGIPTLGDILRSRSDLTLFESMLKTSSIQQLVPCPLTFFAVPDDKARDFQGGRPPPCLAKALARPENQRNVLKLIGRLTALGRVQNMVPGTSVPVLHGNPGRVGRRGQLPTWNGIDLDKQPIVFDRGVIHTLARNDLADGESRELLRQVVYYDCLHDHLVQHPSLTRFALLMVDNRRSLPIIGMPPGPRPDWVARDNPGWFPPPTSPRSAEVPEEDAKQEAGDKTQQQQQADKSGAAKEDSQETDTAAKDTPGAKKEKKEAAAEEERSAKTPVHPAAGGRAAAKPKQETEEPQVGQTAPEEAAAEEGAAEKSEEAPAKSVKESAPDARSSDPDYKEQQRPKEAAAAAGAAEPAEGQKSEQSGKK